MAKIDFAIKEVIGNGMPKDKAEAWKDKITEFADVDIWANAVYADAFNYVKNKNGNKDVVNRMGLPYTNNNIKPKKLWED
jgi:hemoglobin-like flavoprotein